jgi:hypothetical protein
MNGGLQVEMTQMMNVLASNAALGAAFVFPQMNGRDP